MKTYALGTTIRANYLPPEKLASETLQNAEVGITVVSMMLSVGIIVALFTTTHYSEKAVQLELDALGPNILILPPHVSLSDYYSADHNAGELPEQYVDTLLMSNLEGIDSLSPKLSCTVELFQTRCLLTGILPKNEFQSKSMWQAAGVFARPKSCGQVDDIFGLAQKTPKAVSHKRVIETLHLDEILVGADVARNLGLKEGQQISLADRLLQIAAILPVTGTIDDSRIFAHLHTVQEIAHKPGVLSAIEIVGCCDHISKGLVTKLGSLFGCVAKARAVPECLHFLRFLAPSSR